MNASPLGRFRATRGERPPRRELLSAAAEFQEVADMVEAAVEAQAILEQADTLAIPDELFVRVCRHAEKGAQSALLKLEAAMTRWTQILEERTGGDSPDAPGPSGLGERLDRAGEWLNQLERAIVTQRAIWERHEGGKIPKNRDECH